MTLFILEFFTQNRLLSIFALCFTPTIKTLVVKWFYGLGCQNFGHLLAKLDASPKEGHNTWQGRNLIRLL
jgi:hypothetical protein